MSFADMTWNQIAKEVHQNAVDHGWWDGGNRPTKEILQLVSTEVSEATEAVRINAPPVYVEEKLGDGTSRRITPDMPEWEQYKHFKTEGEAVELADGVIRLLDWAGRHEFNLDDTIKLDYVIRPQDALVAHYDLNEIIFDQNTTNEGKVHFFLKRVLEYFTIRGWNLTEVIELKHNYNKTRGWKHGGKSA